ncbi:MAG TPA: branched-chain amino acid ABC transporter permease [Candidatus Lustribacter sp.]
MKVRPLVAMWLLAFLLIPLVVPNDFWLSVGTFTGIAAIGAIGLNLLIGYTGQLSLAQPVFLGTGAYVATHLAKQFALPMPLWLIAAGIAGGILGVLIGALSLRFREHYLIIISIAFVFLGEHIFVNWHALSGGLNGISTDIPVALGSFDFAHLSIAGRTLTRNQGFFWLTWGLAIIGAWLCANLVRTRPGRAMQAVRDREIAAAIVGINPTSYKIGAFVVSSVYVAIAGALYAAYARYIDPNQWNLTLAVQYLAMVVIGGAGTIAGPLVGAVFIGAVPALTDHFASALHIGSGSGGGLTVFALDQGLFGFLIIYFLMREPRGLVAIASSIFAFRKRLTPPRAELASAEKE